MRTINKEELINDIKELETNIEFINTHCESRYYGEPKAKVLKSYKIKLYHLKKKLEELNETEVNNNIETVNTENTEIVIDTIEVKTTENTTEAPNANTTTKKKVALLIPAHNTITDKWFYIWETPNERTLSKEYDSRQEAIKNRPQGYIYKDDGWNNIIFN